MGIFISHGVPSSRSATTIANLGKHLAHTLTGSEWREISYLFDGRLYTPVYTPPAQAARVRTALGMPGRQMREDEGETARRVVMWSQRELSALYERVGGTITTRTAQRTTHGGESTWQATEITVTVDLPGIGTVEVFTDWDEESGGRDLPLMQAIPGADLIAA